MAALVKVLRDQLEKAVKNARDVAEAGARAALRQLAVDAAKPFDHLTVEEQDLRNRLRAHARQLGDQRDPKGGHGIEHLVVECAYEHWHRMLFARFLAENHVLMHPTGVPVTLEDCEELARNEGAADGWELAGRYAARMLPQIFRPDHPVLQVKLPPEHQRSLDNLLADLARETFTANDSLGWVYQFWQAKKKDDVNRSEVKIGADELPAVTQLFTEPYMVAFLLDNALGAWWAAGRLSAEDLRTAATEEELRQKASLPGVPLTYLRFVRREDGAWTPAAGTFDQWPAALADLKVLDPCCGSGHFLVAVLYMLAAMRMELEALSAREAVDAVLRGNLHGLEIDERCTQIAAFSLALAAWTYPDAGGYRQLPELNVACSGLGINARREDWVGLAGTNPDLRRALEELHQRFQDAPVLGSLIDPEAGLRIGPLFTLPWAEISPLLEGALGAEQDETAQEMGIVAHGLVKAAKLLAGKYGWIITNVPYLARGRQDETLRAYCDVHHDFAKSDLATAFLERCLQYCTAEGTASMVLPQNWLFLTTYRKLREKLLKTITWHLVARMGPGAFETISGEVVKAILLSVSRPKPAESACIRGLDVSESRTAAEKSIQLYRAEVRALGQEDQLHNPDSRITLESVSSGSMLSVYADAYWGQGTGDFIRFGRYYWEPGTKNEDWEFGQTTVSNTIEFGGRVHVVFWQRGLGQLVELAESLKKRLKNIHYRGAEAWNKVGVSVSLMNSLPVTIYTGQIFDGNCASIIPKSIEHVLPVWAFCSSSEFSESVRRIDQKLNVTNHTLLKIPFDLDHWTRVAAQRYPDGLPKPHSDDPTQWIFHGNPAHAEEGLQTALVRLLGYRWPAELDPGMDLADVQRTWVDRCQSLLPLADDDGIVCLPSVRGEETAEHRLQELFAAAYGETWSPAKLEELLGQVGCGGKGLEHWLREKFFEQHCTLFLQRPFIWHIWDGIKRDGFAALVNYHKLDRKLLETLTYNYLGDWITRQEDGVKTGADGAQERLASARALQHKLELILEGESPYDIFVRWKPIEEQPLGWEPDLNDGVRLNIRPFVQAGVLRKNPKIEWGKDRGKDPEDAPWFRLFKGDRINDHHLTLAEKKAAREK